MEQHPIPRQITSFEFKLIGFMTLRQFIYLVAFIPVGVLFFLFFPIPIIKQVGGLLLIGAGLAFAFVPINDRPLDVWVRNFVRRLFSATQYTYHKENTPIYFFDKLMFVADPHQVFAHVESQDKLKQYLLAQQQAASQTQQEPVQDQQKKHIIGKLLSGVVHHKKSDNPQQPAQAVPAQPVTSQNDGQVQQQALQIPQVSVMSQQSPTLTKKKPTLVGVVKNNRKIPLPGILIYVRDPTGKPVRLMKTNPHGVFATYNPLQPGDYTFDIKDPKGGFMFDTMKYKLGAQSSTPLEFHSKEML